MKKLDSDAIGVAICWLVILFAVIYLGAQVVRAIV